ncbi:unnamed protein product [Aphanomyces euteiches]|uniref:Protein kinase domain-containing protein n=1 Tax=Aphanomyces euteiches TaxID=100861 RepID=A0A6G0WDA0_9STRA|nr:hypothetical protein Ae201684_016232 [Aphanomyces euteiches]KAH9095284.1 hypothetical protein Ae201684P_013400 [Aphanomyces euteiches]KAH9153507.1 hypothetical protein AeRB84_004253 [Aphanomyces euteiches]
MASSGGIECFSAANWTGPSVILQPMLNVSNTSSWSLCSFQSLRVPEGLALVTFPETRYVGNGTRYDTSSADISGAQIASFVVIDRADEAQLLVDIDSNLTDPWIVPVGSEVPVMENTFDMIISALHVPRGAILVGYRRRYFLGSYQVWTGDVADLGSDWVNRIRSFRVLPENDSNVSSSSRRAFFNTTAWNGVAFYVDANFSKISIVEPVGEMVPSMADWPYAVEDLQPKSVNVSKDAVLVQFNGTNFQGAFKVFSGQVANISLDSNFLMRSYKVLPMWSSSNETGFVTCLLSSQDELVYIEATDNLTLFHRSCLQLTVPQGIQVDVQLDSNETTRWKSGTYAQNVSLVAILPDTIPSSSSSSWSLLWIVWVGLACMVLGGTGVFLWRRRRRHSRKDKPTKGQNTLDPVVPSELFDAALIHWHDLDLVRLDANHVVPTSFLASGGSGEIWRGTFRQKEVAIKSLHRYNQENIQKFVVELSKWSKLHSPHIVACIGATWTSPWDLKGVLEFMRGGDMRSFLSSHSRLDISWKTKISWAKDVADGLFYIHSMPWTHRDIKARNVLLETSTNTAKIGDFGTATDVDATKTAGVGTYRWMAPEMLAFESSYTAAVDIYAFGVLLSELDTHQSPYAQHNQSDVVIAGRVLHEQLRPSFSPDCPVWLRFLAFQCLATDPAHRPTTARILHVLATHLRQESAELTGEHLD